MRIVLDTNVLVSGSFFRGISSRILDACVVGKFDMVVSPEILAEYQRVGEEFSRKRPNEDFAGLLALLLARALVVEAPPLEPAVCRDPDNDKFIACALAGRAVVIVSGDKDLLDLAEDIGVGILSPREFMTKYMTSVE